MSAPPNVGLKWPLWPESDRAAWSKAISRPTFLGNPSPAAYWSPPTRKVVRSGYSYWLSFLHREYPESMSHGPSQRVTVRRIVHYSEYLTECVSDQSRIFYIRHLFGACRAIDTDRDWTWFDHLIYFLAHGMDPPAEKFVHTSTRLFWLGIELMEEAETRHMSGRFNYRDGLLIALLAVRPVRAKNIANVNIGRQFRMMQYGYRLVFADHEVKNRKAQEFEVPASLNEYIERYLKQVRPRLPGADLHGGMWPSRNRRAMRRQAIYERVRKHTGERLGTPIGLHAFRAAAATTVAQEAPAHVGEIPAILGNETHSTVERYYNLATTLDASERYQEMMDGLLEELG